MEKKTPLYKWHEGNGGKIIPFGGYLLPVQYETGLIAEHCAVRNSAGLFDVSHMGEFLISGAGALDAIQHLFTNDFAKLGEGRVRYTLMCNESGGIIDDLLVFKMKENRYFLVVNASNREKDAEWIKKQLKCSPLVNLDIVFEDLSDEYALIALQGPASAAILSSVSSTVPEKYYSFMENGMVNGINCIISRTGYTGESGFELYCDNSSALGLWELLLSSGKETGLIPCGLGARDTLRLEAGMPLYGHEMDESINPFEADLSFAVKMNKPSFIGKEALVGKENPILSGGRIRTGLKVTGRGIIREGASLFHQGELIGISTSGTFCPYLKQAMAMALIRADINVPGTLVEADVRGKMVEAEVCKIPFYKL